jgi:hypothetical protein
MAAVRWSGRAGRQEPEGVKATTLEALGFHDGERLTLSHPFIALASISAVMIARGAYDSGIPMFLRSFAMAASSPES